MTLLKAAKKSPGTLANERPSFANSEGAGTRRRDGVHKRREKRDDRFVADYVELNSQKESVAIARIHYRENWGKFWTGLTEDKTNFARNFCAAM